MPLPWLAAALPYAIPAAINFAGGLFGAHKQKQTSMELAKYQYEKDFEMLQYQNQYNSPASQMARYKEAGLNPNLVYGQGSPGNMQSAPSYPGVETPNYMAVYGQLGTQFQQARLLAAQADLTTQKVNESGIKQDLMKAQESLVNANPYLNKSYVESMVLQLESSAKLKEQEKLFMTSSYSVDGRIGEAGFLKMQKELETLYQRFNLSASDQKIKAKILESKEFQNAILEVQKKWMTEKEITPQHIYQGIMLLLSKMM